jgi:hypothetical protein
LAGLEFGFAVRTLLAACAAARACSQGEFRMSFRSLKLVLVTLVAFAAFGFGQAQAQTSAEPTLKQIYAAAQSGHVDEAQQMVNKVLKAHPESAKAHYVAAELHARAAEFPAAREELATAEKLAPGLAFAKPEAVQALRSQLTPRSSTPASPAATVLAAPAALAVDHSSSGSGFPWFWVLILGAGGVFIFTLMRRKAAPVGAYPMGAAMGGGMQPAAPGYGQPGYGPTPMGGAPGGMGSGIMGGLATGLAVGAGVVAAQEIGHRMFGNDHAAGQPQPAASNGFTPIDANPGMGGDNFGVNDASSWDDAGSGGAGGDNWDN